MPPPSESSLDLMSQSSFLLAPRGTELDKLISRGNLSVCGGSSSVQPLLILFASLGLVLALPVSAHAYIGPGAGFALVSSFLMVITTMALALVALLAWPFRALWRRMFGIPRPVPLIKRLIIVGLDGQDPVLTADFMKQGKLPNFSKLASGGTWSRLRTTFPSVSPVAWSSFSTGTNPARHNIFDFISRDPRTYLPVLSSVYLGTVTRFLRLGRFRIPLHRPELRLLRKSKPFWALLGEHRVWSTILRVPVTFPPDRFYGAELSAMSVPDLLGTQGSFTLYTTRQSASGVKATERKVIVQPDRDRIETRITGPENPFVDGSPLMCLQLTMQIDRSAGQVTAFVGDQTVRLVQGVLSNWVPLRFSAAGGITVHGICRFLVTELEPEFSLYVSPISIDPDRPAMPISHPSYYATYLAARIGKYSTIGLAEDTAALNEGVIDDSAFLRLAHDIDREREAMFFAALDRLHEGMLVCVFDATDRIQHMFWRDIDAGHPAALGRTPPAERNAIEDIYIRNDELVGKVMGRLGDDDVLMVLSDHGFNTFRRCVNLNRWLRDNGYLDLKAGADGTGEWHRDVDWSRTRAYALGLTSLFLNVRGREASGIVAPGEDVSLLKTEIIARLSGLRDADTGEIAIREVFDTSSLYRGPYLGNAPDLMVAYNVGYRVSWGCASGVVAGPIFEDNVKPWSGDHCVDPRLVPGVFFCNRPIDVEDPSLLDIAPTALELFGIRPPAYMEGTPLFRGTGGAKK